MTLAAGRVVAMAFSKDGPNLFWSNPRLGDVNLVRDTPEKLVGGFGGDRLWFAPELDYHWNGAPDWEGFLNYKVPAATDPGDWRFIAAGGDAIGLGAQGVLTANGTDRRIGFEVQRTVRLAMPPLPKSDPLMKGVDFVGIETSHLLRIDESSKAGTIDLWHLLQLPIGSALIVPLKATARAGAKKPLSYGRPGGWIEKSDHILWKYGGEAHAKIGLPPAALTGRTAALRQIGPGRWCLIVRQFPTDTNAAYGDHPYGVPREDQVFQAWDGYGFGEMEYHSPVLDAGQGPRELRESDQLWAFGGSAEAITAIALRLIGVDIGYLCVPL